MGYADLSTRFLHGWRSPPFESNWGSEQRERRHCEIQDLVGGLAPALGALPPLAWIDHGHFGD